MRASALLLLLAAALLKVEASSHDLGSRALVDSTSGIDRQYKNEIWGALIKDYQKKKAAADAVGAKRKMEQAIWRGVSTSSIDSINRYSESDISRSLGRCSVASSRCELLDQLQEAEARWHSEKAKELSTKVQTKSWKASLAKIGASIATVLATIGAQVIDLDSCFLSGGCGECRNFYIAINSGSVDGHFQGPILLYHSTRYDWGTTCQFFTQLINSGFVGVGGVGNSVNTVFTGVEGSVLYTVLDLSGNPTDCRVQIKFNNPYAGSNSYSAALEGAGCDPSLKVQAGQYIKGDSAQVQFYAWYDTIWASTEDGTT